MSYENYQSITNALAYGDISHEELMSEVTTPIKAYKAQNPDYAYFDFLDFSIEGTASFDGQTSRLVLSDITATIEPSVLLNDNKEYQLVFLFVSDHTRSQIAYKEAVYTGKTLTLQGESAVQREGIAYGDTTCVLKCYIADSYGSRISKIYNVKGNTAAEYDLSTESRHITLTVTPEKILTESYPIPTE